ncbi:MAG: aminotransferase class V-fold PLP-dependent enzyme [Chloroflexota bacterium]|nr:aminotransferase class V-fold PLP-dependent enzyme [Chloroflexota bacterium]
MKLHYRTLRVYGGDVIVRHSNHTVSNNIRGVRPMQTRTQIESRQSNAGDPHRDLLRYRDEFPILGKKTFMNTCSLGALSNRSIEGVQEFLGLWAELGASAWYRIWVGKLQELREAYGLTIGAAPDRIALTPSISVAAAGVASGLDFSKRKKVVMADLDFPTLGHQFLARRGMGVEVDFLRSPDRITVPLEMFDRAIDETTALVATSHVYFTSGAIQDIAALAHMAHERGAMILVDAYQGTGQLPTDVKALGIDFYMSGSLKWLIGGPGITFLYVSEQAAAIEPTVAGWWGMGNMFDFDIESLQWRQEAARYEMGTPSMASVYAALGGLSIINEIGIERIRERDMALTEDFIARATEAGFICRVAPNPQDRTSIVILDFEDPRPAVAALAEKSIIVDSRPGAVRVSPYFYNSIEENGIVIDALKALPR